MTIVITFSRHYFLDVARNCTTFFGSKIFKSLKPSIGSDQLPIDLPFETNDKIIHIWTDVKARIYKMQSMVEMRTQERGQIKAECNIT
ncbi:MAG: hypothetical protein U0905_18740 [Pirellulales bacterium]